MREQHLPVVGRDLLDAVGLHVRPLVGERRVRRRHIERGDALLEASERDRGNGGQLSLDAESFDEVGDVRGPDVDDELCEHRVDRSLGRGTQPQGAAGLGPVDLPRASGYRQFHPSRLVGLLRADALLEGGREDERLERRPRLAAVALGSDVELLGCVVSSSHHGEDPTGAHLEGEQRGGRVVRQVENRGDGRGRGILRSEVDCGLHDEATAIQAVLSVLLGELLDHPVGEIGGTRGVLDQAHRRNGLSLESRRLLCGEVVLIHHQTENEVASVLGRLRLEVR